MLWIIKGWIRRKITIFPFLLSKRLETKLVFFPRSSCPASIQGWSKLKSYTVFLIISFDATGCCQICLGVPLSRKFRWLLNSINASMSLLEIVAHSSHHAEHNCLRKFYGIPSGIILKSHLTWPCIPRATCIQEGKKQHCLLLPGVPNYCHIFPVHLASPVDVFLAAGNTFKHL